MNARRERGMMLLLALVVMMIASGVVTTLLMVSMTGSKRERGRDYKFKSREIAEAGVDLSLVALRQVSNGVDDDDDGTVDQGYDLHPPEVPYGHFPPADAAVLEGQLGRIGAVQWVPANDANGNGWPDFGEAGVNPVPFSGGEFFAYTLFSELDGLDNDGDGTVDDQDEAGALTAVAWARFPAGPGGIVSTAMYNGVFETEQPPQDPPLWLPNAAIASGGSLIVSGTSDIKGDMGSVHSNDIVTIQNGPCYIEQNATAVNGVVGNVGAVDKGIVDSGPDLLADIPDVRPEWLKPRATHIFKADGAVYDQAGNQVSPPGANYGGWKIDAVSGEWTLSGNVTYTGVGFFEGDVKLAGMGSAGHATLSVIATGNIQMAGNGTYSSAMGGGAEWLFVAGGDIKLTGAAKAGDQVLEGLIVAQEQVHQSGNSDVFGAIMASNLEDSHDLVVETRITGTAQITFNGNVNSDIPVHIPNNRYILDPTFKAYEER